MKRFAFPQSLKLKSTKSIHALFEKGDHLSKPPLKIFYHINETSDSRSPKVAFAVPKKNFKRAVDRNLIKRRMREAFRINKEIIISGQSLPGTGLEMIFHYYSREIHSFTTIETSMLFLLHSLGSRISKSVNSL